MQPLGKSLKAAKLDGGPWKQELSRFLLHYRTTPYCTTGVPTSELLFNRQIQGKLPILQKSNLVNRYNEAREKEGERQQYNKRYADEKRNVRESPIKVGDYVLWKQERRNKLTPNFNETPHIVISRNNVASLGPIASSVICFFTIWFKSKSQNTLHTASFVFLGAAVYQVILASQSPTPWLYKSHAGSIIAVLGGLTTSMFGTYIRLTISIIMREESRRALYWCGMSIQIGSFIGAFSIFPFVNILHDFHGKNAC
ncbi:solute carrier family 52, riboflavin transporter, member 3-B-like [Paramuricea clavata]|uniref:Riboflavin transporter n=1 Tax=Paramuricea clavata TaxID=317549 RepID=A0A6S7JFN0_PARCT|nr:solute carrier family 52, riboflavin transporter, member 3-B-like [Paramuricea clavata]